MRRLSVLAAIAGRRGAARLALCVFIVACSSAPRVPSGVEPPVGAAGAQTPSPTASAPPRSSSSSASASEPRAPGKLNVVVITVDSMRADMPWAGYARDIAPNLTALEKQSVSYTRAYAISSYTAMSMAGFLSGRYPAELPRSGYYFSGYPESVLLFPELLQKAGVRTVAAHAHFYFGEEQYGLHQGFDVWELVEGVKRDNLTDNSVTSEGHADLAIRLLSQKENTSGQFFAWFHFMDPHDRYKTHDGFTKWGTGQRDRYDGEIAFTDHHIGRLLAFIDAQPWAEHTALVISSDHGEAFGEHKQTRHGFELWENLVRVPMFFRIPGVAPRRIDTPRSHIDLAPTIMALLGVPPDPSWHGKSLVAEIREEVEPEPRDVIVDLPRTTDNDRRRGLVSGRHKLLSFGDDFRFELYDVVADPGEKVDLRRRDKELYERMKERYRERVKTIRDICPEKRNNLRNKRPENDC